MTERIKIAVAFMADRHDALGALAPMLRVRPELQDFCRFGGNWRSAHAAEEKGWAAFHMLTRGACQVERAGQPAVRLEAGDVLLLPKGDAHLVYGGDEPTPLQAIGITQKSAIRVKETPGVACSTELICGRLHLESATDDLLLRLLPHAVVLRLGARHACGRLVKAIRDELASDRSAAAAIARDLASALFVMLLRAHLEAAPPVDGLLALLADRETASATLALLKDPARAWSLDELASASSVSRATLVRAFQRLCGMPPYAFLTEVRLSMAWGRIVHSSDGLAQIAVDSGYQSEAALSRAVLRRFSARPGALRRADKAIPRPTLV